MEKSLTIVFDLDNTLLDTEMIKELFRELAVAHGYSEKDAYQIYQTARVKNKKIAITLDEFIKNLKIRLKEDGKIFEEKLLLNLKQKLMSQDLLLPGAKELLSYLQKKGLPIYLLSLGVKKWQEDKIVWVGLGRYFKGSHIVFTQDINPQEGKAGALKRIFGQAFDGDQVLLFNDKPDETGKLLEIFPKLRAFLRKETRDQRYGEADFERLAQKYGERVRCAENLQDFKSFL